MREPKNVGLYRCSECGYIVTSEGHFHADGCEIGQIVRKAREEEEETND